jgi:hypothetical protein
MIPSHVPKRSTNSVIAVGALIPELYWLEASSRTVESHFRG